MDKKKEASSGREGRLPALAPLANPYVPFQQENPPKYEARWGMIRGTLFPGLDLPFMGMANKNEKPVTPMSELQALGFAVQELALYLDTHRDDLEALELYRNYQKLYQHCMADCRSKIGVMNHTDITDQERYAWLDDPWPWEYCKNKEV